MNCTKTISLAPMKVGITIGKFSKMTVGPLGSPFSLVLCEKVKPKIISFLPAFIWLIITFILLVLPGSDIPKAPIFNLVYFDKWVHIGMFGVLMLLWGYPFFKTNIGSAYPLVIIA